MGTVIHLPRNIRSLNAVRQEVGQMAKRYGASTERRKAAWRHAFRLMVDADASSAWAIQAARQDLREPARAACGRPFGGDAA